MLKQWIESVKAESLDAEASESGAVVTAHTYQLQRLQPQRSKQAVEVGLDGSASTRYADAHFEGSKFEAMVDAVGQVVTALDQEMFWELVTFDSRARIAVPMTRASDLDRIAPVDLGGPRGYTNIGGAIQLMTEGIEKFFATQKDQSARASLVLMSDGLANCGPDPILAAARAKANPRIKLITVAFGLDADSTLMQRLATSPIFSLTSDRVNEIRDFLHASIVSKRRA